MIDVADPRFTSGSSFLKLVNAKVKEIVITDMQIRGVLPSNDLWNINIEKLTQEEMDCRRYCPASVKDNHDDIFMWLNRVMTELVDILNDDNEVYHLSLRAQYLLVKIFYSYIEEKEHLPAGRKLPEYDMSMFIEPDAEIQRAIEERVSNKFDEWDEDNEWCEYSDTYLEEDGIYAGEEEKAVKEWRRKYIKDEITDEYTDIRCWVGHPHASVVPDKMLLFENDDYRLLDTYSEEELIDSGMAYRYGLYV